MSVSSTLIYRDSQTVLITGVAGFVGSHLAQTLLSQGHRVVGVDNFLTGRSANVSLITQFVSQELEEESQSNFIFIEADVTQNPTQYLATEQLAKDFFDIVFHLASPASPPRYQAYPVETYQVNAFATHMLLTYLREHNPAARFVFASTSEVYGDPEVHPQPETYWGMVNPNGVRSCYDEAKRLGESICGVFERDFDLDVRIMRIFNTYGPRMDPTDGRVIPNFISQAVSGTPLTIYGTGSQTRSYCFVSDLVHGIIELGMKPNLKGTTINLGNPDEYTILETAQIIYELVHNRPLTEEMIEYRDLPGDDPTRRRPDISRAKSFLGWQPEVSLVDGLTKTVDFFLNVEKVGK